MPCVQRGALEEVASELNHERPIRICKAGKDFGEEGESGGTVCQGH